MPGASSMTEFRLRVQFAARSQVKSRVCTGRPRADTSHPWLRRSPAFRVMRVYPLDAEAGTEKIWS